jgi:hypothetical protein
LLAKAGRADFADLRRLIPDSDQDALIQMQTRLAKGLTACLKAYCPVALSLFSKLQQRSTLLFLQAYPTPEMAQAASVEQIAQVLKQAGHPQAHQRAPQLFQTLQSPQLRANPVLTRAKARLMLALVAQLQRLLAFNRPTCV